MGWASDPMWGGGKRQAAKERPYGNGEHGLRGRLYGLPRAAAPTEGERTPSRTSSPCGEKAEGQSGRWHLQEADGNSISGEEHEPSHTAAMRRQRATADCRPYGETGLAPWGGEILRFAQNDKNGAWLQEKRLRKRSRFFVIRFYRRKRRAEFPVLPPVPKRECLPWAAPQKAAGYCRIRPRRSGRSCGQGAQ